MPHAKTKPKDPCSPINLSQLCVDPRLRVPLWQPHLGSAFLGNGRGTQLDSG